MDYKKRLELFERELSFISRDDVRTFTEACIKAAPDYVFYDCPASSTGKYHSINELGGDGTIVHTKKVVAVAMELINGLNCVRYKDEVCAAAILHDLAKQGIKKYGHTVKDHPQIMARLIADVYKAEFVNKLDRESALLIYFAVFYHYGPWTIEKYRKPLTEYTMTELAVYIADYIASRRFIKVSLADGGYDG